MDGRGLRVRASLRSLACSPERFLSGRPSRWRRAVRHASRVGARAVSAHHIVRMNRRVWFSPRPGATMCVVADAGAAVEFAASGGRRWLVPRPGLFELLGGAERVVQVSAPAGSGKTFLLRSWIAAEDLGDRTAWVSVGRGERDPQTFWLSVVDSLRQTRIGSKRVRELTAAPDLDGATVVRRLREDLGSLDERVWLVIDDLHELQAQDAIGQLEVLLASAPLQLRVVLLTREDLRFSADDSRALLQAAGVQVSDAALGSLVARTEGWAAGLRLAAMSLARDP